MPLEKPQSKAVQKAQETFAEKARELPKKTIPCAIRFQEWQIDALKNHFESRGLKLSQGLRMIITDYAREKDIF